jgi:hypothetical protein
MSFSIFQDYSITAADATTATLTRTTGANPNEELTTPNQIVITWPSAAKKSAEMVVGKKVAVHILA